MNYGTHVLTVLLYCSRSRRLISFNIAQTDFNIAFLASTYHLAVSCVNRAAKPFNGGGVSRDYGAWYKKQNISTQFNNKQKKSQFKAMK